MTVLFLLRCLKQIYRDLKVLIFLSVRLLHPQNDNKRQQRETSRWIVVLLLFESISAVGSESYEEGKTFSHDLSIPSPSQISVEDVPHYGGEQVAQTDYLQNPEQISDAAASGTHDLNSDVGSTLKEGLKTRREFPETFDQNHPIIVSSNEVIDKPLDTIGGNLEGNSETVIETIETTHSCDEAGDPEEHACDKIPLFTQQFFEAKRYVNTTISGTMFKRYRIGGPQSSNPYIQNYGHDQRYHINVVDERLMPTNQGYHDGCNSYGHSVWHNYQTYTDFELIESEQDTCAALESYDDRCAYHDQRCLEGPETRMIFGRPVFKDCWRLRRTYLCVFPAINTCGPLRAQGCDQTAVSCKKREGDRCVIYTKMFTCRSQRYENGKIRITGDVPFCLDGNCDAHGFDGNKNFAHSISKLSIFREMAKDLESGGSPEAFKGNLRRCSRSILNFQDCCGGSGGWGNSLKLAGGCNAEEKLLQTEKQNKTCVYVGTHCAEKEPVTKRCLKKKSTYCCFGSKIAKIFQEQGRPQIGIGWGDSKNPNCRALSVEELQRIDFDRIDLSELFEDIAKKTNLSTINGAADVLAKDWSSKINDIKQSDKKSDPQGGEGGRVF